MYEYQLRITVNQTHPNRKRDVKQWVTGGNSEADLLFIIESISNVMPDHVPAVGEILTYKHRTFERIK